jgi:hypothetical protein
MATVAGIWNPVSVGFRGRNELERMAMHVYIGNGLLNLGHVARRALAAGAAVFVVCVFVN